MNKSKIAEFINCPSNYDIHFYSLEYIEGEKIDVIFDKSNGKIDINPNCFSINFVSDKIIETLHNIIEIKYNCANNIKFTFIISDEKYYEVSALFLSDIVVDGKFIDYDDIVDIGLKYKINTHPIIQLGILFENIDTNCNHNNSIIPSLFKKKIIVPKRGIIFKSNRENLTLKELYGN